MEIYFLRHGIAEDFAGSDYNRALTARGRRRVQAAAAVMQRLGLQPARIYSSPRLRARQTADIVAATLGLPVTLVEAVDFGFDLADVERLIHDLPPQAEVLFVGHNPSMSILVEELTGAEMSMKKGGLARIDIAGHSIRTGQLVWLVAPRVFCTLQEELAVDTPPQKLARANRPLQRHIAHRWSPVGFDSTRLIAADDLQRILDAGRWAASSYNLQPWRFVVAPRQDSSAFDSMLSILVPGNQTWAQQASVLMIAVAQQLPQAGRPNRHATYDLGQAVAQMSLQALDMGIYTHQMGGFFPDKAREVYRIPADFLPFTAIAMGYRAQNINELDEQQRQRDESQRVRQPLSSMVFGSNWGEAANWLE